MLKLIFIQKVNKLKLIQINKPLNKHSLMLWSKNHQED